LSMRSREERFRGSRNFPIIIDCIDQKRTHRGGVEDASFD